MASVRARDFGFVSGIVLGTELDFYGRSLGEGRVPNMGAILGMMLGA